MKHYNAAGLRKPFSHPIWGRLCLFTLLLAFPIIAPVVVLWENRGNLVDEFLEIAQATFLPWKNRRKERPTQPQRRQAQDTTNGHH